MVIDQTEKQRRHKLMIEVGQAVTGACEKDGVPRAALERLITDQGQDTVRGTSLLIEGDWLMAQPRTGAANELLSSVSSLERDDVVFVPDMDAAALTAFAKEKCRLTHLDEDYAKWNYFVGLDEKPIRGRGKRFEVLTWKPNRNVSSEEVRKYFLEKGFSGHAAAFTAWVAQYSSGGCYASILEDSACLRSSHDSLCVPVSNFGGDCQRLGHLQVRFDWSDRWCFVAFREL